MKLLLDQGLPRSAAFYLGQSAIVAVHVGDIGLATADDSIILDHARREGQILVTLDADFHALMALSKATQPSVIRIRIEGLRGDDLAKLLQNVLKACSKDLTAGALVSVLHHRIRVRGLPIA